MSDQSFRFEKFMRDIEKRAQHEEDRVKQLAEQEDQWQARELQQRYREHPLNRVRVTPKK